MPLTPLTRDQLSVARIVDEYADMVLRLARLQLKNHHDAEDVTQDVFCRLYERERSFDSDEHLKAWLIRVTVNRCRDLQRSVWKKRVALDDTPRADSASVDNSANEVYALVAALPEAYRDVIFLHYYEGYQTDEIARILQKNANTVRTHLARARKILEQQWKGELPDG